MAIIPLDIESNNSNSSSSSAPPQQAETPTRGRIIPLEGMSSNPSSTNSSLPAISELRNSDVTNEGVEDSNWKDRAYANARAAYAGALSFGSSLVKVAEKMDKGIHYVTTHAMEPMFPGATKTHPILEGQGAAAQAGYEQEENLYQKNVEKYPETAVSKFIGENIATAPLLSSKLMTSGMATGKALAGTAGEYLGGMTAGSATGAAIGGLQNHVGNSPDDAFDESGALVGGTLGAGMGAAGTTLNRWGQTTTAFQQGKEALQEAGYKGPVLARDYSPDGVIKDVKNKLLDNIPFMTGHTRADQKEAVQDAVKSMVGTVSTKSVRQDEHYIGKLINSTRNQMTKESDNIWSGLFTDMKKQGVNEIALGDKTKEIVKGIDMKELSRENAKLLRPLLGKSEKAAQSGILDASGSPIRSMANTDAQAATGLAPDAIHSLKRNVWQAYIKAAKRDTVGQENVSNNLRDLYWSLDEDIGNTLSNHAGGLELRYKAAKEFSSNMFNVFDPKKDRALSKAVHEVNEKSENLKGFISSIMKPKTDRVAPYYNKVFGDEYSQTAQSLALKKSLMSSTNFETGSVNLNTFFKGVEEAGGNNLIQGPTLKALDGLNKYANKVSEATAAGGGAAAKRLGGITQMAIGAGAVGVATGNVPLAIVGGVAASAYTLGWISRHSPAKNALIGLSRVWDKNPQMTEKLMEHLGSVLPKAGVLMHQQGQDTQIYKDNK